MRKPDVSIHLDKRRKKDNNLFPLKVRVALSRTDFRLFSIGIDIYEADFEKIFCGEAGIVDHYYPEEKAN
jgi:hypothetical protein